MIIKLTIEYDGTNFCGWQIQDSGLSVQESIETAIGKVFHKTERIEIYGAGRTDTGVHALAQVAHFDIVDEALIQRWKNNCQKLTMAINYYLQDSGIVIVKAEVAPNDFHARFSAKMRSYRYLIHNRSVDSVLYNNRAWQIHKKLDEVLMNESARDFIGTHDLTSFRSSSCGANSPIKTISDIKVYKRDNIVIIDISAKSFLHNQVRITVGTLKQIGTGALPASHIKFLLNNPDRTLAGPTAPPCGLYLKSVEY